MAESRSLQQSKKERTTAKQRFSRLANSVMKSCEKMSAEELEEAFSKVALEADQVMETNGELETAWTEEAELEPPPPTRVKFKTSKRQQRSVREGLRKWRGLSGVFYGKALATLNCPWHCKQLKRSVNGWRGTKLA
ncbi:hypothetical protein DPEC_G00030140 [Dallia pectoralis]|uniref:Uncharacterized protein n=1 Tax=Dallia pectoralis TaxID=75939 RepID=A0ACC2HC28_DALPE|nr:hypothetical protein DPEC_G00030140 [Dallia pectoralis]